MTGRDTRGKPDFIILRDEGQNSNKLIPVDDLIQQLHSKSLNGHLYQDSLLPGMNKAAHFQYSVIDSDFIICITDGDDISEQFDSQISLCHKFKVHQGIDDHIIHVFTDPDHQTAITTRYPKLSRFITLYESTFINEDNWIDRIIQRMTTPSLGELKVIMCPISTPSLCELYVIMYTTTTPSLCEL